MAVRSETIGSLLRPDYLLDARRRLAQGDLTAAEFKRLEDRAVDEAVALQESAGLDILTDGEQRRYAFFGHLVDALEGFDKSAGWAITFHDEQGGELTLERPVVVDKLRWRRQMSVEEFTYLRGRTSGRQGDAGQRAAGGGLLRSDKSRRPTPRATPTSPTSSTSPAARSQELRRLGCEYVQIDAPQYAALLDETIREGYRQRGSDPDRMLDACIELDNAIIEGHAGMTFGIHICRGNYRSMFYASGGYDRIAAQVFRRSRFDRFLLEYDDERSGTFEPLRHVPDDRTVVLGLVSTKKGRLESTRELETRIAEAARVVPLERLALSPQCGFASTTEGNRLSFDEQRRKLELVGETARRVWSTDVAPVL
jgi:5-methyltetrahydropteroyltriglutamate--homocysteine methyltransferase